MELIYSVVLVSGVEQSDSGLYASFVLSRFSRVWLCVTLWIVARQASVHGILQARILERVAMPSSSGSSQPRDWTRVTSPALAGGFFTT